MRDRPSDLNLPSFGEDRAGNAAAARTGGRLLAMLATPIVVLKEVSKTSTFWILFATFFICGLSTNGLIQTHFVTLCGDFGILPVAAASVLAVMGIFDFFGTIGSGWLSDRFDNRWLLFWYYGLRGLSLLFLPFSDFSLLRPVDLRRLLRPRLDRHRAADGQAGAGALRSRKGRHRLRLDLHRPSAGRRHGGLWCRPVAHRAAELPARLLHRRRLLPAGLDPGDHPEKDRPGDGPPSAAH
jgi:hypothetical protein